MKFLPLRDFSVVTGALNFDTPDCHVTGGCDLYTTKAAGSDKKLYKNIDKSLESQHASMMRLGASLSPPEREQMAASMNLSRSSPFGPLSEMSSRRTYAYLIATLNASHPDYDFSHVLRPTDFKHEKNMRRAIGIIDSTLTNVRASALNGSIPRSYGDYSATFAPSSVNEASPTWGPQMWAMIDKEMDLKGCQIFSYQPADDPFEEDEPAVWSFHYFFFNKAMKRVVYIYARGVPVLSHSPNLRPHRLRRGSSGIIVSSLSSSLKRSDTDDIGGASKRARYWLGDRIVENALGDEEDINDTLIWNRDEDGELEDYNNTYESSYGSDEEDIDQDADEDDQLAKSPIRGVSEDIAARMELD